MNNNTELVSSRHPELLHELVLHLVSQLARSGRYDADRIIMGELPPAFPLENILPPNSKIIASIPLDNGIFNIMFNTTLSVREVGEFYKASFESRGWTLQKLSLDIGGFVDLLPWLAYSDGAYGRTVFVNTYQRLADPTTRVRLLFTALGDNRIYGYSHERDPAKLPAQHFAMQNLLPKLTAPQDVPMQVMGSGGSGGVNAGGWSYHSDARVETLLVPGEMLEHFNAQLVTAGWILQEKAADRYSAWSSWQFKDAADHDCKGGLVICKIPDKGNWYSARLTGEWTPEKCSKWSTNA